MVRQKGVKIQGVLRFNDAEILDAPCLKTPYVRFVV